MTEQARNETVPVFFLPGDRYIYFFIENNNIYTLRREVLLSCRIPGKILRRDGLLQGAERKPGGSEKVGVAEAGADVEPEQRKRGSGSA